MAAPNANKIQARTRTAEFEVEDDLWVIKYRPLSLDVVKEAMREGSDDEKTERMVTLLERMIVGWNLEDDDGAERPFDPDWLRAVGLDYVGEILNGILADMNGPKASPTASSGRLALVGTA